jgi:hypothetical protein
MELFWTQLSPLWALLREFFMHYWQLIGRSLTLRSQSPSARKLASVIAAAFVEIR